MTAALTPIREADFQNNVVHLARLLGWRIVHFGHGQTKKGYRTPVRYDGKGYVDLTLFHPQQGRILFAELKSAKGRISDEQAAWADIIRQSGGEYHLWRPDDIYDSIPKVLGAKVA